MIVGTCKAASDNGSSGGCGMYCQWFSSQLYHQPSYKSPDAVATPKPNAKSNVTSWYQNPCITGALGKGAASTAFDAIGLIPEGGGFARMIGHGAGYVGAVADQAGSSVVKAVGASAGTIRGINGIFDTSPQGLVSDGLTVAGFVPGLGQGAAVLSMVNDAIKTGMAVAQCQ